MSARLQRRGYGIFVRGTHSGGMVKDGREYGEAAQFFGNGKTEIRRKEAKIAKRQEGKWRKWDGWEIANPEGGYVAG